MIKIYRQRYNGMLLFNPINVQMLQAHEPFLCILRNIGFGCCPVFVNHHIRRRYKVTSLMFGEVWLSVGVPNLEGKKTRDFMKTPPFLQCTCNVITPCRKIPKLYESGILKTTCNDPFQVNNYTSFLKCTCSVKRTW